MNPSEARVLRFERKKKIQVHVPRFPAIYNELDRKIRQAMFPHEPHRKNEYVAAANSYIEALYTLWITLEKIDRSDTRKIVEDFNDLKEKLLNNITGVPIDGLQSGVVGNFTTFIYALERTL